MAFEKLKFKTSWEVKDGVADPSVRVIDTYVESEGQVREDYQVLHNEVRDFINNKLLPALEATSAAKNIGVEEHGNLAAALAHIVEEFKRGDGRVDNMATGMLPGDMLAKKITFAETDWKSGNGVYSLSILYANHTRVNDTFGYRLWCNTANGPVSDCWAVQGTSVVYINGTVILTAEEPYSGHIVFTGVATEVTGQ